MPGSVSGFLQGPHRLAALRTGLIGAVLVAPRLAHLDLFFERIVLFLPYVKGVPVVRDAAPATVEDLAEPRHGDDVHSLAALGTELLYRMSLLLRPHLPDTPIWGK